MKALTIVFLVMIALLAIAVPVGAQDDEIAPIVAVEAGETQNLLPALTNFANVLSWLGVVGALLVGYGAVISIAFDKTVKPTLTFLFSLFPFIENQKTPRTFGIVVGVFVAAFYAMDQINANIFTLPLSPIDLPEQTGQTITAIFAAVFTFIGHDRVLPWLSDVFAGLVRLEDAPVYVYEDDDTAEVPVYTS